MHLMHKWCSPVLSPKYLRAYTNASTNCILFWGSCNAGATWSDSEVHVACRHSLSVSDDSLTTRKGFGISAHLALATPGLLAGSHTETLTRMILTRFDKNGDKNRRENGKASWGRRKPTRSVPLSLVLVRRPWRGTPICDLPPPLIVKGGKNTEHPQASFYSQEFTQKTLPIVGFRITKLSIFFSYPLQFSLTLPCNSSPWIEGQTTNH